MNHVAWGLVTHSHATQRQQLSTVLQNMGLQTQNATQLAELMHLQPPLGSLWMVFDEAQATQSLIDQNHIKQLRAHQMSFFWGILVIGQAAEESKQNWIDAGADAYLSYPFDRNTLLKQLQSILDRRTPLSYYQVLPNSLAQALDKISIRLDSINYYELLEVNEDVDTTHLQQRFHQRSLLLHPDRHRSLKVKHSSVYQKVNEIYKRVLEAYRVLSDPMKRSMYNTLLPQGHLRWSVQNDLQLKEVLKISQSSDVQNLLAQAMSARSQGQLITAYAMVQQALHCEPSNASLQTLLHNYSILLHLVARDKDLIHLLPMEFST